MPNAFDLSKTLGKPIRNDANAPNQIHTQASQELYCFRAVLGCPALEGGGRVVSATTEDFEDSLDGVETSLERISRHMTGMSAIFEHRVQHRLLT
jgi:hypothetical protein